MKLKRIGCCISAALECFQAKVPMRHDPVLPPATTFEVKRKILRRIVTELKCKEHVLPQSKEA